MNRVGLGLPLSPYALRYNRHTDPYWSDGFVAHSALAPELPYIPAAAYHVYEPHVEGSIPCPDNPSLDHLFYGERWQRDLLGGPHTWQLAPLLTEAYGLPGGRRLPLGGPYREQRQDPLWDAYYANRIEVNEEGWFEFFKKGRWFDWRVNCFETIVNPLPGMRNHETNWWTVDNPVIWENMRVSIELADRILKRLCQERNTWLDAFLVQERYPWADINLAVFFRRLEDPEYSPMYIPRKTQVHDTVDAATMRQKLEEFNSATLFGFLPPYEGRFKEFGLHYPTNWRSQRGPAYTDWSVCSIFVGMVQGLCSQDTTLHERYQAQVMLGVTIVHEVMHATWYQRWSKEGSQLPISEPFMNCELQAETGYSLEKEVFGGGILDVPFTYIECSYPGRGMHLCTQEWPSRDNRGDLPPSVLGELASKSYVSFHHMPLWWVSAIGTESFWNNVVGINGKSALHAPRILGAEVASPWYYIGKRTFAPHRLKIPDNTPQELVEGYVRVFQRWQDRRATWDRLRPWYSAEYRKWSMTPWSWIHGRSMVNLFRWAHAQQDIFNCLKAIRQILVAEGAWVRNKGRPSEHPMSWLWASIASLMIASIPLLEVDFHETGEHYMAEMWPSKSVMLLPHEISETGSLKYHAEDRVHKTTKASIWRHPQEKIIDFCTYFREGALRHPQPRGWTEAMADCGRALWNRHCAGAKTTELQPNEFDIPEYDPTDWTIASQFTPANLAQNGLVQPVFVAAAAPVDWQWRFISPPPSPALFAADFPEFPDPDGPQINTFRPGRSSQRKPGEGPGPITYYTISEVGDHIVRESSWVVEPSTNGGYDVYRITRKCADLGYTTWTEIRDELLTIGPNGPELRTDCPHSEQIRGEFGSTLFPIGKLLMQRRPDEVAEHNGRNGMPRWITLGSDVFDITRRIKEMDNVTWSGLRQATPRLPQDREELATMVDQLLPYRCAKIQMPRRPQRPVLLPLTLDMLGWHDNPTAGCYTAIHGMIYDITEYLEMHPGGRDLLISHLGREAMAEFAVWHGTELMEKYPEWRVGRLVPHMRPDQVGDTQVIIHDWVYDFSALAPDKSSDPKHTWIFRNVSKLGGSDASEAIREKGEPEIANALTKLFLDEKHRIVGMINNASATLREISDQELRRHTDHLGGRGAWLALDGLVYDVSTMIKHSELFYRYRIQEAWTGQTLPTSEVEVANWLRDHHSHRIIGRLVSGPAWDEPTVGQILDVSEPLSWEQPETAPVQPERKGVQFGRDGDEEDPPPRPGPLPDDVMEWIRTHNVSADELEAEMQRRERAWERGQAAKKRKAEGVNEPRRVRFKGNGLEVFGPDMSK